MQFSKHGIYEIEWVDEEESEYNEYGLGINACRFDKRDNRSQRLMAHESDCNKGHWKILTNADDLGSKTYNLSFVSSAHGGDKQFVNYNLVILDEIPNKDQRNEKSQFVCAHQKIKGKWLIQPASAPPDDSEKDDDSDDNDDDNSELYHIVFVSNQDNKGEKESKFAGYSLQIGDDEKDHRDHVGQFVMASKEDNSPIGTWRITCKNAEGDDLRQWVRDIVGNVTAEKLDNLMTYLRDEAGVETPKDLIQLEQEHKDCFNKFVELLPALKRKVFHQSLQDFKTPPEKDTQKQDPPEAWVKVGEDDKASPDVKNLRAALDRLNPPKKKKIKEEPQQKRSRTK